MMRDLSFLVFIAALMTMGLRQPFLFVLTYVYVDLVSPQRLTYLLLNSIPLSLIAFVAAVGGWVVADRKQGAVFGVRQGLILLLILYCFATTMTADFPIDAKDKWEWVWKSMIFAVFLPLTLRTKLRIEALTLFMVLSVSSIVIVGGIKTVFSGGGYGALNLMVASNSGLYEGSTISTVAIMIVPMVWWLVRYGTVFPTSPTVVLFGAGLTFACLLIPIGTSTRTGLLCIGLLAVLTLREVKKPGWLIALMVVGAIAAVPLLPSNYTQRMGTIRTYQGDASASTRLEVWKATWEYAKSNPLGGGFNAYLSNSIRYETVQLVTEGGQTVVRRALQVERGRAYHSAYFELLGEQGYPGLLLWLVINLGGIVRMEMLRRRFRETHDDAWIGALASALQNAHLIYLLGAAFVGVAYQSFLFMLIALEIGVDAQGKRAGAGAVRKPQLGAARKPASA